MAQIDPRALKVLRKKSRLNQAQLADLVGVSKRQVAEWERERGDSPPVSIRTANLKKLCGVLRATEAHLTGEEPLLESAQGDLPSHQLSVRISSIGRLNYELIEEQYDVSRQQLIEAAPMLFMLLARQSLSWRARQLESLKTAVKAIQEQGEAFIAPEILDSYVGMVEGLEREEQAIGREEVLTPSSPDLDYRLDFSNRFADYLIRTAMTSDIMVDLHGPISVFPDYLVCPGALREICGGASAAQMPRAAYALVAGAVSLAEIPEELRGPEGSEDRSEWLAQRAPEYTGGAEYGYSFCEDRFPSMSIYI